MLIFKRCHFSLSADRHLLNMDANLKYYYGISEIYIMEKLPKVYPGWETKFFRHSPELGSVSYSLYKIPLAQACFTLPGHIFTRIGEQASACFPACVPPIWSEPLCIFSYFHPYLQFLSQQVKHILHVNKRLLDHSGTRKINMYRIVSNIRRTKSQNLNDSHLVLKSSLPNPLKPGVKSRMKM